MKFLHHLFSSNKPTVFDKIEGYEDVKDIVIRALLARLELPLVASDIETIMSEEPIKFFRKRVHFEKDNKHHQLLRKTLKPLNRPFSRFLDGGK